jgi:hypothetical protein
MSTTSKDLRELVAQLLDDASVGTYRPAGGYQTGDTAPIFFSRMPATPDRCIVVTTYPRPAPHEHGVQVRCRGAAKGNVSAEDLADAARTALHDLTNLTRGNTVVDLLSFVSGGRLGFDAADRDEVALNFRAVTSDPSTALID